MGSAPTKPVGGYDEKPAAPVVSAAQASVKWRGKAGVQSKMAASTTTKQQVAETDEEKLARLLDQHPEMKPILKIMDRGVAQVKEKKGDESSISDVYRRVDNDIDDPYWNFDGKIHRHIQGEHLTKIGAAGVFTDYLKFLKSTGKLFDDNEVWECYYAIRNCCWSFSDASFNFAKRLGKTGLFPMLIEELKEYKKSFQTNATHNWLVKCSLGILHNCAKVMENRTILRQLGLIDHLLPWINTSDEELKTVTVMTLAYIVGEEDNELIMTDDSVIGFILTVFTEAVDSGSMRSQGFSAMEMAMGISQLAQNDDNKVMIVEKGALPLLVQLMETGDEEEQEQGARAVWQLAFHDANKDKIRAEPRLMYQLKRLKDSKNPEIAKAANGALWVLDKQAREEKAKELTEKSEESSIEDLQEGGGPHIMISYQWDHQKTLIKVKDRLQSLGYRVWMDLEQMGGSTLQAMAEAVENSAVVLICMSQKYKESPNCRTEAEYTFQLRKQIVPLMMEAKYKPDGWLGAILGAKLYFDFSAQHKFEDSIGKLTKELGQRGKTAQLVQKMQAVEVGAGGAGALPIMPPAKPRVLDWKQADVDKWIAQNQLEKNVLRELTGPQLHFLQSLRGEAPEFFYQFITNKLKLASLDQIMRFTSALNGLDD
ncbi:Hypp5602 [Branchiostoma lanceolatum]|uniref:Hypp5602 protein n=1 Tax=Branchiostoma lanceolatum TaxID=7740 RepID=A0A8J9W3M3_BRALA|nr:Hypp5602 [Branchiostoma lanceolatum]